MTRRRTHVILLVLLGLTCLALIVAVPAVRLLAAVLFCLFAPGYGWARRLRPAGSGIDGGVGSGGDGGDTAAVTIALSISATVLVGTVMAVTGWWSPLAGLLLLLLVAVTGHLPWTRWARRRDGRGGETSRRSSRYGAVRGGRPVPSTLGGGDE